MSSLVRYSMDLTKSPHYTSFFLRNGTVDIQSLPYTYIVCKLLKGIDLLTVFLSILF